MQAVIKAIEYYTPSEVLSNEMLAKDNPDWPVEKIVKKIGISNRYIAGDGECASDLGVKAAQKLFQNNGYKAADIDFLLFCTQSPDYFLPTTACLIQDRLGIPTSAGAMDYNLGCSGYVYGLGLAKGLIETGQVKCVMLITAETYSKFIHPADMSVRSLFSDAAAATLLTCSETDVQSKVPAIGPFVYGTDGRGGENLIVRVGALRFPNRSAHNEVAQVTKNQKRVSEHLYMNGSEIFTFTLLSVPKALHALLDMAGLELKDIDLFVFHQANKFMLEHLMKKLSIPKEKFYMNFQSIGNTVSSTIPIALKDALNEGVIKAGDLIALVGFGVGYSWGATLVHWH